MFYGCVFICWFVCMFVGDNSKSNKTDLPEVFFWVGPGQNKKCLHYQKDSEKHILNTKILNIGKGTLFDD